MKKLAIALIAFCVFCSAIVLIVGGADYYYRHHRAVVIDTLKNPIYIKSIGQTFVTSTANEKISIPKIQIIPNIPNVIQRDLYKYGLEKTTSGECFGLFRIHHWCGNDH